MKGMQEVEQWVQVNRKREAIQGFLLCWRWQWFCSMNLPSMTSYNNAERYLNRWRRLSFKQGVEVGYIGLWSRVPHSHVHLFMVGEKDDGFSLFHVEEDTWEKEWSSLTKQTAVIQWINDVDGVTEYVSFLNTPSGDLYELLIPYNTRILNRCRRDRGSCSSEKGGGHRQVQRKRQTVLNM